MGCISPPELDDSQLLASLDGDVDEEVMAHLARCTSCRQRAQRLGRLQDMMTKRLYRLTCPPSEELGEYHLGLLEAGRVESLAAHLVGCPHCARELSAMKDFLADVASDLQTSPFERVRVLIAELVQGAAGAGSPGLAPAYVGLRGEGEEPITYQAEEVRVLIEFQPDTMDPNRKMLLGLAVGLAPTGGEVRLHQETRLVALTELDELGNFVIPGVPPGRYDLTLSGEGMAIQVQGLTV